MGGVNKVILVGNLGADPEVRYTQSGTPVANLRIATTETWNDKDGKRQERTEWHRVVVWGKQGENCGTYLAKGRQVYVEGRLQSREYTDKHGVERRGWEVNAQSVVFLKGGDGDGGQRGASSNRGGGSWGSKPESSDGGWGGGGAAKQSSSWGQPQGGGAKQGGGFDDDPIPF